jgi:superfamily II DNA/RNA helicase
MDINVGNERTNIYIGIQEMRYPSSSFKDLSLLIDPDKTNVLHIPKTIVYIDDVNKVTLAVIALNGWLHSLLQQQGLSMPVHAWMPPCYCSEAMARFALGEVQILICTEAAGMVCKAIVLPPFLHSENGHTGL